MIMMMIMMYMNNDNDDDMNNLVSDVWKPDLDVVDRDEGLPARHLVLHPLRLEHFMQVMQADRSGEKCVFDFNLDHEPLLDQGHAHG